jgi:hypothetical protein
MEEAVGCEGANTSRESVSVCGSQLNSDLREERGRADGAGFGKQTLITRQSKVLGSPNALPLFCAPADELTSVFCR